MDFKLKAISGRTKGPAQGRSGSRATLSRGAPSEPQVRDGSASNSSLAPAKAREASAGMFGGRLPGAIAEDAQDDPTLAGINANGARAAGTQNQSTP